MTTHLHLLSRSRRSGIISFLLCIGLMLTLGVAQASQEFGIGPVYQNDQHKGWLIYELKPGDVMDDEIFVANVSDKPITLRLYVQDALSTVKDGDGFKVPDEGTTPEHMKFVSKWVSLEKSAITLDPYSRESVKIKTIIPPATEKKEYAAVIFAHHDPTKDSVPQNVVMGNQSISTLIGARIGVRQYINVTDTPNMPKRYIETNATSINGVEYMLYGFIVLMIIGVIAIIVNDRQQKKSARSHPTP